MAYNYYTTTYLTKTIHVVEAKTDSTTNVQVAIMGLKYDVANNKKLAIDWHDTYLESNGWTRKAVINGGIFFTEGSYSYANGIEKIGWTVNEQYDDTNLDPVIAIGHTDGTSNQISINLTSTLRATLDQWIYRGAITGAFGLLRNGSIDQGNTSLQGEYSSLSGRSIVGNKADGTIVFASVAGVTGSSGLTGAQTLSLAQTLGLYNAIAMDGGGSVSLVYDDVWKVQTSRTIKNAIAIYTQDVTPIDPKPMYVKVSGATKEITSVKFKTGGTLKNVSKVFLKVNGVLKQIF